jgi:hypothetical protein
MIDGYAKTILTVIAGSFLLFSQSLNPLLHKSAVNAALHEMSPVTS